MPNLNPQFHFIKREYVFKDNTAFVCRSLIINLSIISPFVVIKSYYICFYCHQVSISNANIEMPTHLVQ